MAERHLVRQGEHLSSIAADHGFADYRTIWNHGENAELKKKRVNPNVLFPGDVVYIPDKEAKSYNKSVDTRHKFKVHSTKLQLNLVLHRTFNEPLAGVACELWIEGRKQDLTTGGGGELKADLQNSDRQAVLIVKSDFFLAGQSRSADTQIPLYIGSLDPVEEKSGQVVRLANLGYYFGDRETVDEDELLLAIEEFQCENNLTVDGKCGAGTQAKLKEVYGC